MRIPWMTTMDRPVKRTPVSQILGVKDVNRAVEPGLKKRKLQTLRSVLTPRSKQITTTMQKTPLSSIPKMHSTIAPPPAHKPKFKILSDSIPTHKFKQHSPSKAIAVSQQVSFTNFKPLDHAPKRRLDSITDTKGILDEIHAPLARLNSWFALHTPNVLHKDLELQDGQYQTVAKVVILNEMLVLVTLDDTDTLLLNYCQSLPTFNRIQEMTIGDKVMLKESLQIMHGLKLFYDWKLKV